MRLITVEGEGKVTSSPDTIEVSVELVTLDKDYDKMIEEAVNKLNLLNEHLMNIGFKKKDIKTTDFTINAKYENIMDQTGKHTNEFVGYEARQNIILEFPYDTKLLGEVIAAITRSVVRPNISIRFTIKYKQTLLNSLLDAAVKDAMNKANILASASGVRLGNVESIEHKRRDHIIYSDTRLMPSAMYGMEKLDITPKDILLTEQVLMSFEIV